MQTDTCAGTRGRGRPRDAALAERRREEILVAATRIFADRGYPGTDVQVIADEVGVGKGTVYRYFPSKQELFLAAVERGVHALRERLDVVVSRSGDPRALISDGVREYLAFFDENSDLVELFFQERAEIRDGKNPTYFVHREAAAGKWLALARDLIDTGQIRPVPPERILSVVDSLLYGAIFTSYFATRRRSLASRTEDILDVLFHGILSDPEREAAENE